EGRVSYIALCFWGSSAKPSHHISYRTAEQRDAAVAQYHANIRSHQERKVNTAEAKAAWVNPLTAGTIDQLLADAKRRRFDVLICWRLDRLGRSLKHLITLLEELQAWGI